MAEDTELITLKNSNPLVKYPVDAEQLNYNFSVLSRQIGTDAIKTVIESTGQVYAPEMNYQLASAIAQYVLSAAIFTENGSGNVYILQGKDGIEAPIKYTDGMAVYFKTTHTNSGASTIQINQLAAYPILLNNTTNISAGYIAQNTLLGFRFNDAGASSYWSPITATSSSGSSSGSESSGSDTDITKFVYNTIIQTITSAHLEARTDDATLLSKAISTYIGNMLYDSAYADGVYSLTTKGDQVGVTSLTEGMVVFFVANAANDEGAFINVNNTFNVAIVDVNNNRIAQNSILPGDFVYCVYTNGNFKLFSNHHATLSLNNGVTVDTITNDVDLSSDSSSALPTEHAVKSYIDTKVKGTTPNIIIEGYEESPTQKALYNNGGHIVQLVTNSDVNGFAWKDLQSSNPNDCIASGNTQYAHNVINKLNGTYWESEVTGFLVDGLSRVAAGMAGAKYIQIETDSSGNPITLKEKAEALQDPTYPHNDASFIGIKNNTQLPTKIMIQHTDSAHTPQAIKYQISFDDTTFYDIVDSTGSMNYGVLSSLSTDQNGYYVTDVPTYYKQEDTIVPIVISTTATIRVVAALFNNQYVNSVTVNEPGYDPNKDRESEQTSWQVSDLIFCKEISSPAFILSYPDNSIESVNYPLYSTQYEVVEPQPGEDEDENLTELAEIDNGRYVFYKIYSDPTLYMIPSFAVYTQIDDPVSGSATPEEFEGSIWVKTSTVPSTTYIYSAIDDTTFQWKQTNLMFLGSGIYSSNALISLDTFQYGNALGVEYPMTSDFTQTIIHNFGTDVDVSCYLVCTVANNSYSVGEEILVDNNITSVFDGTDTTVSYFQVTNTKLETKITAHNLFIMNRTTHDPILLPIDCWKLRVYIIKDS